MQRLLSWIGAAAAALMIAFVTVGYAHSTEMSDDDVIVAQYVSAGSAVMTLVICAEGDEAILAVAKDGYTRLQLLLKPRVNDPPETVLGRSARLAWVAIQQTRAKQQYLDFDPENRTFRVFPITSSVVCSLALTRLQTYMEPGGILDVKEGLDAMNNVDDIEQAYLLQANAYSDWPTMPIHERWTLILTGYPEVAERHLYDDMTDIFTKAYRDGSYREVFIAHDLAVLQGRFFITLKSKEAILPHVFRYKYENCCYWSQRLVEKWAKMSPARRVKNRSHNYRIVPEKVEAVSHQWLH